MRQGYVLLLSLSFANSLAVGSMNRDPADWPENSYVPDVAAAVDSQEDQCREAAHKFWKRIGLPDDRRKLVEGTAAFAAQYHQPDSEDAGAQRSNGLLTRILAAIIDSGPAALLTAQCIDFVTGTNVQGAITEADIGRKNHLSRAAISKRCILLCEELGLQPGSGMRKLETRKKYRLRQRGRRARSARPQWSMGNLLSASIYGR